MKLRVFDTKIGILNANDTCFHTIESFEIRIFNVELSTVSDRNRCCLSINISEKRIDYCDH